MNKTKDNLSQNKEKTQKAGDNSAIAMFFIQKQQHKTRDALNLLRLESEVREDISYLTDTRINTVELLGSDQHKTTDTQQTILYNNNQETHINKTRGIIDGKSNKTYEVRCMTFFKSQQIEEKLMNFFARCESIIRLNIPFKRLFLGRVKQIAENKQKIFISKIFYLLSKKYKHSVDENFINDQIKYYIIKENITDPGLLNYVNDTESIKIDRGECKESYKNKRLEQRLKLYLSIELFYPLDAIYHKYTQLYCRNFMRCLQLYIKAKEHNKIANRLSRMFNLLESNFTTRKREGLFCLKKHSIVKAEIFLQNLYMLFKKKELNVKYNFFRLIGDKDRGRFLSLLLKHTYENNLRRSLYKILRFSLHFRNELKTRNNDLMNNLMSTEISYDPHGGIIMNEIRNNSGVIIDEKHTDTGDLVMLKRNSESNDCFRTKLKENHLYTSNYKVPKKDLFSNEEINSAILESQVINRINSCTTIIDRRRSSMHKMQALFTKAILRIDNLLKKKLEQIFDKLCMHCESMTMEHIKTPDNKCVKTRHKRTSILNKTSLQNFDNHPSKVKPFVQCTSFIEDKTNVKEIKNKQSLNNKINNNQKHFEVIGIEDKTHTLEPKTLHTNMSNRSIITSKQLLKKPSFEVPLVNESSNFSTIEQINRYNNVLQNTLRKISTISDLKANKKPMHLSQGCLNSNKFNGKKSLVIKKSNFNDKPSPKAIERTKTTKSISSLFNPNFDC